MRSQKGAVSIFVVVFSALFVTIITVSFVGLMIRAQQQASNADLSNSAYDSALAGVEDGKRVLLEYRQCLNGLGTPSECATLESLFNSPKCNMVRQALTTATDEGETLIKSVREGAEGTSKQLDQAYTCVEIAYTAREKELQIKENTSELIPIDSNGKSFDTVTLSWFFKGNAPSTLTLPANADDLPERGSWSVTTPPVLRAQLIQHGTTFNSTDFDADQADGSSNTKSAFLMPSTAGQSSLDTTTFDSRPADDPGLKTLKPITCTNFRYQNGQYACSVDITLPTTVGNNTRSLYLNLMPLYNSTKVKIELKSGGTPIDLVAPSIDSTGRANNLFRRVKVGVSFIGNYPRANFDITGNLCKNFSVTNDSFVEPDCKVDNP